MSSRPVVPDAHIRSAHIAAKLLSRKSPKGTTIALAPNPKDIVEYITTNRPQVIDVALTDLGEHDEVGCGHRSQATDRIFLVGHLLHPKSHPAFAGGDLGEYRRCKHTLCATVCNNSTHFPLKRKQFRTTGYVKFLDSWTDSSPVTFAIVSGFLPPAVAGIFIYFLPRVMRWLTQYMGASTHARLDRAVIARYFAFLVISQLIIFTLIGVVFSASLSLVAFSGVQC